MYHECHCGSIHLTELPWPLQAVGPHEFDGSGTDSMRKMIDESNVLKLAIFQKLVE